MHGKKKKEEENIQNIYEYAQKIYDFSHGSVCFTGCANKISSYLKVFPLFVFLAVFPFYKVGMKTKKSIT